MSSTSYPSPPEVAIAERSKERTTTRSTLQLLVTLFKLRIVALLLLAATGGAFLGAGGWPGSATLAVLFLTGGTAAAGAGALNEYLERDIDAHMGRTHHRPLVVGAVEHPSRVALVGVAMVLLPVLAVLPSNPALAFFVFLGAVIYVGVYTLWLKPRTVWNIVIGGAAGSCAVLSGGAAAGAWNDPGVLALAVLLFLWTPIHFWSLAVVYREDYARAGVPMLPVRVPLRRAVLWSLAHGAAAGAIGLALVFHPALGPLYLVPVFTVTAYMLGEGVRLLLEPSGRRAWRVFHASNLYLATLLLAICIDTVLRLP